MFKSVIILILAIISLSASEILYSIGNTVVEKKDIIINVDVNDDDVIISYLNNFLIYKNANDLNITETDEYKNFKSLYIKMQVAKIYKNRLHLEGISYDTHMRYLKVKANTNKVFREKAVSDLRTDIYIYGTYINKDPNKYINMQDMTDLILNLNLIYADSVSNNIVLPRDIEIVEQVVIVDFYKRILYSSIPEPTSDEIQNAYNKMKKENNDITYENMKTKIRNEYIKKSRKMVMSYKIEKLYDKYDVRLYF